MKSLLWCPLAIATLLAAQPLCLFAQAPVAGTADSKAATPRLPDGHPDLNGVWTERYDGGPGSSGKVDPKDVKEGGQLYLFPPCCGGSRLGGLYTAEQDGIVLGKGDRNKPVYKPEFWAKVRYMERNAQKEDGQFSCQPWGVPRMGQPQQIVQKDGLMVFLYATGSFNDAYRVISMNSPHDPDRVAQETPMGDSVGNWEGDTLVVDTIGFDDQTWLTGKLGYVHSTQMHVVERFTRQGNEMRYEVTIDDPVMLARPWIWAPKVMKLNTKPHAMLPEDYPCSERDVNFTPVH
jgi:hypothetical protein